MTIRQMLDAPEPTLSYELFPPRSENGTSSLWETIAHLAATRPDFTSLTYGASGSTRGVGRNVVKRLVGPHSIPPLAHLTCVDASRAEITQVIEEFLEDGVRNILALRGDPPAGQKDWTPHPDGLLYASDLVALIREVAAAHGLTRDDVSIGVTSFPAAHANEQWRQQGLDVLKAKQEAGADFSVTQVFYDAQQWIDLDRDAKAAGIDLPMLPGVIPLENCARASRLEQLSGVAAPADLIAQLEDADEAAARAAGVAAAAKLTNELIDAGAPGVHIYTFNKYQAALELVHATGLRPQWNDSLGR